MLLIACANVASLLLVRFVGRQKEFALRTALGASRASLLWQTLAEPVWITIPGDYRVQRNAGVGKSGLRSARFASAHGANAVPYWVYAEGGLKMISAEVIKGVQELLENRGVSPKMDERYGDFVARGLGVSARQSEVLLQSLHDGDTVEQAIQAAEIDPNSVNGDLLVQIARAIGSALGRVAAQK